MKKLKPEEMQKIKGGTGMTAAMLNALIRTVSVMYTMGQAVGSAIRRAIGNSYC